MQKDLSPFVKELLKSGVNISTLIDILRTVATYTPDEYDCNMNAVPDEYDCIMNAVAELEENLVENEQVIGEIKPTQTIWVTELELDGSGGWDWSFNKQEVLAIGTRDYFVCSNSPNFLGFALHRMEVPAELNKDQIQEYLEDHGLIFDRTDIQINR
jgi:hypothetical protein